MYIDIIDFLSEDHYEYSASAFEMGDNAGDITYNNAMDYAKNNPFATSEQDIRAVKEYFKGFGAWEDVDSWNWEEINALLTQLIAGSLRQVENYPSFNAWLEGMVRGECESIDFHFVTYENGKFILRDKAQSYAIYYIGV